MSAPRTETTALAAEAPLGQRRYPVHLDVPSPQHRTWHPVRKERREVQRATDARRRGEEQIPAEPGSLAPPARPTLGWLCNRGKVSTPFLLPLLRAFGEGDVSSRTATRGHHAQRHGTPRTARPGALPSSASRARRYPGNAGRRAVTAAVKQCGRKAGRMRSRRVLGSASRVFAESACAEPEVVFSVSTAGPEPGVSEFSFLLSP